MYVKRIDLAKLFIGLNPLSFFPVLNQCHVFIFSISIPDLCEEIDNCCKLNSHPENSRILKLGGEGGEGGGSKLVQGNIIWENGDPRCRPGNVARHYNSFVWRREEKEKGGRIPGRRFAFHRLRYQAHQDIGTAVQLLGNGNARYWEIYKDAWSINWRGRAPQILLIVKEALIRFVLFFPPPSVFFTTLSITYDIALELTGGAWPFLNFISTSVFDFEKPVFGIKFQVHKFLLPDYIFNFFYFALRDDALQI